MIQADQTRRSLLHGLVLAFGGGQAGSFAGLGRRARALRAWLVPGPAEAAPAALSDADRDDVVAFAEVVVAGGTLSATERSVLLEHVHDRLNRGEQYYVDLYRTTAGLLMRLAGARFSTLDVAQRVALVTRSRLAVADVRPGETVGDDARAVRTRAVPDLIGAYYASPAGWALVGYSAFPGRCSDLARYTRPEA